MERFLTDLRYAARQMAAAPVFSGVAVLVLALGIGATTAVFGVVDRILLRPLDLPDPDRLVMVCEDHPREGCFGVSPPTAADWGDRAASLDAVGLGRGGSMRLRTEAGSRGVPVGLATPGLWPALGVSAARGRLMRPSDVLPAGDGRVVLASHEFWATELGADPDAVGRTLRLDDEAYTLIGVLPEGLEVPRLEWPRLWVPLSFDARAEENRDWRGFRGYARLADGVRADEAEAELVDLQARLAELHPEALRGWGARVAPMKDAIVGTARPLLLLFLGSVLLVLLIVCVNVASLLLARATGRRRELAIRAALGAGRVPLARQLLAEAALLATLGGVLGVLLALWATDAFVALAPSGVPRLDEVGLDARILAAAVAITVLSTLGFGLAPLYGLRHFDLNTPLRDGRGGTGDLRTARLRRALVVAEVALALILVLSAGLLLRGFGNLVAWDPGFDVRNVLTFQLYPPSSRYDDEEALVAFYRGAVERYAAIPGVQAAGTASAGPLFGGSDGATPFLVRGRPPVPLQDAPRVRWYDAGPGYFPTLGVDVIEGLGLSEEDGPGDTPTALVNETMARLHWPDGSPVGAMISMPQWETEARIVGVVPDTPPLDPVDAVEPAIYVSNRQFVRGASFFLLRVDGDPGAVAAAVRRVTAELDPELEPVRLQTMAESLGSRLVGPRFNVLLVALFAFVALTLGATGLYGVIAHTVALRTREMGIRMALGAAARDVLRDVVGQGLRLVAAGLAFGLVGAAAFTRLLAGHLHGVSAADPVTVLATVALLGGTAVAASLVPALRASRTDPVIALRSD